MKIARFVFLLLLIFSVAYPRTEDLGMGAFSSTDGTILMTVDAALVNRSLDNPYVMFVLYVGAKDKPVTISRKDVVMVYKGQDYVLPSVKEVRENYRGGIRDLEFYGRLGKEGVIASWVRHVRFPERANFFPPLSQESELAVDSGSAVNNTGFMTPLYFKNPGFAKGDRLIIKVRDRKNPELAGECEVVLD
jgi:hypothetical protein